MKFTNKEELAKYTIEYFLDHREKPNMSEEDVDENLKRDAACFVTVYVDGQLRGCIGNAIAIGPLYISIIDNAISAITEDYRFFPITKAEFSKLTTEVTILTPLTEYKPQSSAELLQFLEKEKPGMVIEKNFHRALFLPQVWEQLPKPEDFLSHLCLKAYLPLDEWKRKLKYWTFRKEK
jgi:AmmeMemoRadiSam system protein A